MDNYNTAPQEAGKYDKKPVKKGHFYRNLLILVIILSVCLGSVSFGAAAAGVAPKTAVESFIESVVDKAKNKENEENKETETEEQSESNNGIFNKSDDAKPMSMSAESIYEASTNRINLIKNVKPSVVAISTVSYQENFFFGTQQVDGSGSGFMFAKDNENIYIATNNHVISGASDITVFLDEEKAVAGSIVGTDQNADLAVVSVKINDVKATGIEKVSLAAFGDSDEVKPGDPVVALGNALGEGISATSGIVSVISKKVNIQGKTLTVIQTDAAINPGNSGGPLFNSKGEVIGINTAKFSSEEVEKMGFSITSNVAKPIFEKLATGASTPTLGVSVTTVPSEYVSEIGTAAGAYVVEVVDGGNAAIAGILQGDVITSFNGNSIFGPDQLVESVKNCNANDVVEIGGLRDGEQFTITATLYPPQN